MELPCRVLQLSDDAWPLRIVWVGNDSDALSVRHCGMEKLQPLRIEFVIHAADAGKVFPRTSDQFSLYSLDDFAGSDE